MRETRRSLIVAGWQWWCDSPGSRWSDDAGNTLFLTDGPSWWLVGNQREVNMHTRSVKVAMGRATVYVGRVTNDRGTP